MDLKAVYTYSYEYLCQRAAGIVTQEEIDDMLAKPDIGTDRTRQGAFAILLSILQEANMSPKVIQYVERKDQISAILHQHDLNYISSLETEELMASFQETFEINSGTLWKRYVRGIISGARLLNTFPDDESFCRTFDSYDRDTWSREAFALLLANKIHNMGFALACSWLKELGYLDYVKPDTHIRDLCAALGLASKDDVIQCFEGVVQVAKQAEVKPYSVDKLWWLNCTGDFYRYKKTLPGGRQKLKKDFLEAISREFDCQMPE